MLARIIESFLSIKFITREINPVFSGALRRIPIPGLEKEKYGRLSETKMAHIIAVVRLATGLEIPDNCTHEPNVIGIAAGANIIWAESGSNPRDTEKETEGERGLTFQQCREILKEAEWKVLKGPSRLFNQR